MPRAAAGPLEPITYGSPRFRSLEAGGLLVTDAFFPPGSTLPPHVHDRTCVALPTRGTFDSVMRGRVHSSAAGTLITEPAGEVHGNRFGPAGARITIIQPDATREDLLRPCARFLDSINHVPAPGALLLARRLAAELASPDAAAPLAVEALALELLVVSARAGVASERRDVPPWLARVRDRLHDEMGAAHGLDDLAAQAGVHPAHLTRAFRRRFGFSIGEYSRRVRLDWAARRLADSDEPLVEIAARAGFADQSHFTRLFCRQFGCTPGRFRQRHARE